MINFTNARYCGMLPEFFSEHDPRPAHEQLDENYAHGGGFNPFHGYTLHDVDKWGGSYLQYPADPPMREIARAKLRDEIIILFQGEWVAIVQPDGKFVVTRCD